jgi:CRP-like cAMP-binding protein
VIEDAQLLAMAPKVFEEMIVQNTEIAVRLIRKLAKRLESADSLIQVLLFRDAPERIIENLKRLARIRGWTPGSEVKIAKDLEAMADQVGLDLTEVQDTVSRLTRDGVLVEQAGEWVIGDLDQLTDFRKFLKDKKKFR